MPKPTIKQPFTIKIALLYIIEKYALPIKEQLLTETAIGVCEINYFTLRQCLHELGQDGYVETSNYDGDYKFGITDTGRQALGFFVTRLNLTFRQAVCEYIEQVKQREKRQTEFDCTVFPADDMDYFVRVTYKEGNSTLLDLTFRAGDRSQAEKISNEINKSQTLLYSDIYKLISTLTQNETP